MDRRLGGRLARQSNPGVSMDARIVHAWECGAGNIGSRTRLTNWPMRRAQMRSPDVLTFGTRRKAAMARWPPRRCAALPATSGHVWPIRRRRRGAPTALYVVGVRLTRIGRNLSSPLNNISLLYWNAIGSIWRNEANSSFFVDGKNPGRENRKFRMRAITCFECARALFPLLAESRRRAITPDWRSHGRRAATATRPRAAAPARRALTPGEDPPRFDGVSAPRVATRARRFDDRRLEPMRRDVVSSLGGEVDGADRVRPASPVLSNRACAAARAFRGRTTSDGPHDARRPAPVRPAPLGDPDEFAACERAVKRSGSKSQLLFTAAWRTPQTAADRNQSRRRRDYPLVD